jgi:AraC-like DNA-binding protein
MMEIERQGYAANHTPEASMNTLEQSVPARYFAMLMDYLESHGTPCRDALSAAQIRTLNDPLALLTTSQVDTLVQEMARLTGRRDLGFELGRLIKFNSHDVLGYAMISSPTIDHMLRLVARYYRLMSPMFVFRYQRLGERAEVSFQPVVAMNEATMRFYLETVALSFHVQLMAAAGGKLGPYDIAMAMPEPAHVQRYRELAPARFHFGAAQPGVHISMSAAGFDQPLPMADLRALARAEARCKLLLQEMTAAGKWCDWVAMMLREAEDSQPTLDELARILNISARTLDRYLAREGVSFRDLALAIRNERACELLASGKHPVSQIAYRLGYSDMANFSRSFKKSNGISPSAYMERHRG